MEDGSRKRTRAPNFASDEKARLLKIIFNYKDIIENKKTDAITWREKEQAWEDITEEFNASCSNLNRRSVASVKGFFENQKRKTTKEAAVRKREAIKTGGGVTTIKDDPLLDLTMSIINKKTVLGLDNPFDDDRTLATTSQSCDNYETVIELEEGEQIPIPYQEIDWGNHKPSQLQLPLHHKLLEVKQCSSKNKEVTHDQHSVQDTPKSKKQCFPKSSNASVAKKYEDLAEIKKEVAQTQLRILKSFEEYQNKRLVEEEQQNKIREERETILFNLEVRIKEKQLTNL
ncbi:hypothetical protein FQR65_LT14435 [Abscondita terminalis]|nr:hypothetical protein FQR65_LT14435 [Abscondita terminalis]